MANAGRPRSTTVKTEIISAKDFAGLDQSNVFPGIQNSVFTVRDKELYVGQNLTNRLPYSSAYVDLQFPVSISTQRISGANIYTLDSSNTVMILKVGTTIYLYSFSSGVAPTLISTITVSASNREVYLEAIFGSTEKGNITGYSKYVFLNLPGEAWVVAYNTRIGTWQIEKVNNTYSVWTLGTALVKGNRRTPTVANGYYYEVTVAGTTGGVQPVWPTTLGDTVVDGTVTWICRGRYNNFPTTTSSSVKTLNGYVFVCVRGDIYNSDLDLPDSWNTTDFISTEIYPDDIVSLAKYKNYLVAFGTNTIEFFYDAANTSGSPLARQEGILHNIGCVGQSLVTDLEDQVIWISQTSSQNYSIWSLEKFEAKKISTPEIDTWLSNSLTQSGLSISSVLSFLFIFLFRLNGRLMLGIPSLNFGPLGTDPGQCFGTFVVDLELQCSYYWETKTDNNYGQFFISKPLTWNNYFLWCSLYTVGNKVQLSSLGVNSYDLNSVNDNNIQPLFKQTPKFISKRITFNSNHYKVLNEASVNALPSIGNYTMGVNLDRTFVTYFQVPLVSAYKVHRLGRAREFQFEFSDVVEFSNIEFKYTEHSN